MAITVLNTDAGLSGKTIVTAEGSHTVNGLHTFDRDPNPPFAVSAGSAVVSNLDADKLDGSEGSEYVHKTDDCIWTSWTPSWTNLTVGNGTVTAKYMQLGKLVFYELRIVFGTTTSVGGAVVVDLPVDALALAAFVAGNGEAVDASAGAQYPTYTRLTGADTMSIYADNGTSAVQINTTAPFTWGNTDALSLVGFYEAA
jgi:hypothetical protein